MKVISFNVNSIRTRLHQLEAVILKHNPDFIGLQETKVNDPDFPLAAIQALGYEVEYFGQKNPLRCCHLVQISIQARSEGISR